MNTEFASAAYLLDAPSITERTAPFVNFDTERIDWDGLEEISHIFSDGEKCLFHLALQLWTGRGDTPPNVIDMIVWLDTPNLVRALSAIKMRAGLVQPEWPHFSEEVRV